MKSSLFSFPAEFSAEKEPVQCPFFLFESGPGHSNELVALFERLQHTYLMFTPMHILAKYCTYINKAVHRYGAKVWRSIFSFFVYVPVHNCHQQCTEAQFILLFLVCLYFQATKRQCLKNSEKRRHVLFYELLLYLCIQRDKFSFRYILYRILWRIFILYILEYSALFLCIQH